MWVYGFVVRSDVQDANLLVSGAFKDCEVEEIYEFCVHSEVNLIELTCLFKWETRASSISGASSRITNMSPINLSQTIG